MWGWVEGWQSIDLPETDGRMLEPMYPLRMQERGLEGGCRGEEVQDVYFKVQDIPSWPLTKGKAWL